MKYFLIILSIGIAIGLGWGHYIRTTEPKLGELIIGLSISALFFVFMPVFIYHRWKNKDVKDYMLTKENIEKMKEYTEEKDLWCCHKKNQGSIRFCLPKYLTFIHY